MQGPTNFYNSLVPRIEFDAGVPNVTLYFNSTVPITCPCKMPMHMNTTNHNLQRSSCSLVFNAISSPGYTPSMVIKAKSTPGAISQTGLLAFSPVSLLNSFWDGYKLQTIPVIINQCVCYYDCGTFCVFECCRLTITFLRKIVTNDNSNIRIYYFIPLVTNVQSSLGCYYKRKLHVVI